MKLNKLSLVLAGMLSLAGFPITCYASGATAGAAEPDAAPPAPSRVAQYNTVYVYDKEFRNGTMSVHMWSRTESDGQTVDTPCLPWGDERERMEFTGKQITIDGVSYPVYRYSDYNDATHLLFRRDGKDQTEDFVFTNGALYSYTGEKFDTGKADFNPETDLTPVSDEYKHTVYFQYSRKKNGYWEPWYSMDMFLKAHVWGEGGDLLPWHANETLRQCESTYDPESYSYNSPCYWNGGTYVDLWEYTFYYFGGNPTNIKFHYDPIESYYDPETGEYGEKQLSYYTGDLEFHDGAVYTYDGQGVVSAIDTEPKIEIGLPLITGSFYFIDTDHWAESLYSEGDYPENVYARKDKDNSYESILNLIPDREFLKYVQLNGRWYKMFKFNLNDPDYSYIQNRGKLENILLHSQFQKPRGTGLMPFKDGGVYYFAGNDVVTPVLDIDNLEVRDEMPETPASDAVTVYFHLGANQMMEEELWNPPYCRPIKRATGRDPYFDTVDSPYPGAEDGFFPSEDDEEALAPYSMTKLSDGFYSYTIPAGTDFDDILVFYYTDEYVEQNVLDENGYWVYDPETYEPVTEIVPTGARIVAQLPVSRSRYFDPTHLTDYVFDIGTDCFHQSYMSYDEYLEAKGKISDGTAEAVYLMGNETLQPGANDDPKEALALPNDHGCFFFDLEVSEENAASFKLSSVNVDGLVQSKILDAGLPEGFYASQRGWASYNLGLIGCGVGRDTFLPTEGQSSSELYKQWYESHVVRPVMGQSRQIRIKTNETYGFNDYCQYPWRVEVWDPENGGIRANTRYYLVVDLLQDDKSVTLLDFDPHPHVRATVSNVRKAVIADTDLARQLHQFSGVGLQGAAHSGEALFRSANIASGDLLFGGENEVGRFNSLVNLEGYHSAYKLYLNDREVLSVDNEANPDYFTEKMPVSLRMDYMDLPENRSIALRGRFTDLSTGKSFRTAYTHGDVDFGPYMAQAPELELDEARLTYYADELAEHGYSMGALASISYHAPNEQGMAMYPDYDVTYVSKDGSELTECHVPLVHKDHPIVSFNFWGKWLGNKADTPWAPYTEGEYLDSHSWPEYIVSDSMLPLVVEGLEPYDGISFNYSSCATMNLDVKAVYPFLVARNVSDAFPDLLPAEDPTRLLPAMGPARVDEADTSSETEVITSSDRFKYSTFAGVTPFTVNFDETLLTTINEVEAEMNTDAETEYYTISGIKVTGKPAPGIYICRKGDKARKVIVR